MTPEKREEARETASILLLDLLQTAREAPGLLQHNQTYNQVLPHIEKLKEHPGRRGKWLVALLDFVRSSTSATIQGSSSESSSEDEAGSIFSEAGSLLSVSTITDPNNISATAHLILLFKTDHELRRLASNIIEKEGGPSFRKLFTDLLMLYSKELLSTANNPSETEASRWIERERGPIAASLRLTVEEPDTENPRHSNSHQQEDLVMLSRFAKSADHRSSDSLDESSTLAPDHQISESAEQENNAQGGNEILNDLTINHAETDLSLDMIKDFLMDSPAFSRLKENLHKILINQSRGSDDSVIQGLLNIQEERINRPKVTGKWICKCGEIVQDDYIEVVEGSVEKAMIRLSMPNSTSNGFSATGRAHRDYLNDLKNILSGILAAPGDLRKIWHRGRDEKEGPSDGDNGELPDVEVNSQRFDDPRYLLMCISQWRGYYKTNMVAVDLRLASDKQLFKALKAEYKKTIGPWRRFLSMKRLTDIRFVKFHILRTQLIDILFHSRMPGHILAAIPPYSHADYSYNPKPIDMEPPVGHNTMMHYYRCPADCGNLDFCLRRFPGYKYDAVVIESEEDSGMAWGIELVEGKDLAFLWIVGFLCITCSMVFGILWTLVMKDIQAGFTVAGYIVVFETSLFGTVQVVLENF